MNINYYRNLKRKVYRAHLLSLGFKAGVTTEDTSIYDILEEEDRLNQLEWIRPE